MTIIALSFAWLGGIITGYWLRLPLVLALGAVFPLVVLSFYRAQRKWLITASLAVIAFITANIHAYSSLYDATEDNLRFYNDRGVFEIEGMLARDADLRDRSAQLIIEAQAIRLDGIWHEVAGKVMVLVSRYPVYHYGDVLRLKGELVTPRRLDGFDYRNYLAHQGIYSIMYYPRVELLRTGEGLAFLRWVYALREKLAEVLSRVLAEPQAALAQGILLGMRGNIPGWLNEAFARSGTFHLLAISGLNISIMAGILLGAGILLFGRRHYLYVWLALGAVWVYAVLTGMNAPVIRSAIMASLFLFAEAFGRQRSAAVSLVFACAIMAGVSPYILGDVSFQLSFLAMAGLIFIYPVFSSFKGRLVAEGGGFWHKVAGAVFDIVGMSLAAMMAVFPLVLHYFGVFSFVAPFATLLTVPVLPFIIVTGIITACVGLLWLPLGQIAGGVLWLFLSYMIQVIKLCAAPLLASLEIASVSLGWVLGYYAVLVVAIVTYQRWRRRRLLSFQSAHTRMSLSITGLLHGARWLALVLLLLAVLVSYAAVSLPGDELTVSFLDVGQGDAVFIQRGSQQLLIDGGPSPREIALRLGERMPFWDRSIDVLILTHPHQDHLAGLLEVLRRYRIGRVLYPASGADSSLLREWTRLIEEKNLEAVAAAGGQRLDLGDGVFLDVLYAPQGQATEGDDEGGIVLRLAYGAVDFLLTADITAADEWELLRRRALDACTVLKVPHHGSGTSTTAEFLAVARPEIVVISVGAGNRYGLPDEGVLRRLEETVGAANIYRTDAYGTITFITDGRKLVVKTQR